MSKDKISDYSTTASNNTDIAGIGIQGTNAVSNFDGAFRTIMKQLADMNDGTSPIFDTFTLCDPVDTTKKFRIDAGGITTATTRTYTAPNASGTLALTSLAQTWTAFQTFSVANFATGGDCVRFAPTDFGTNKPGLYINQTAGSAKWNVTLWDGSANNGTIRIGTQTIELDFSSALVIGDSGTENFRFNSDAFLSNGLTTTKTVMSDAGTGLSFQQAGIIWASRAGDAPMFLNRDSSDGVLAQFGRSKTAVGSIFVTTTATSYNTSSSKTLKENWRDFDSGTIIDSLEAWIFDWKSGNGSAYGVLAQDAVSIFPDAVTTDTDPDLWAVDYSKFVPILLREVKELRKRLAAMEKGEDPIV